MDQFDALMGSGVGIVIMIIGFFWAVLMLFAPFFWYGTNKRTRETSLKMDRLIELMEARQRTPTPPPTNSQSAE